jgi:hypothetical protein
MDDWKSHLKNDPLPWLLEQDNPSIRYYALTELLDRPFHDPEVQSTKSNVLRSSPVTDILRQQHDTGYWGRPERYLERFVGTIWQVLLLLELGCDPQHPQIQKAAQFLLDTGFDTEQQCFLSWKGIPQAPCYHGILLWGLLRCHYENDPRVQAILQWVVRTMEFHDGDEQVSNPDDMCLGRHTCIRGVLPVLQALAEVPAAVVTPEISNCLQAGNEFLLLHHLYKRSHSLSKPISAYMTRLTFPHFYYPDVLQALLLLTQQGYHDDRMQAAIQYLQKKQADTGAWTLQRLYNERRPNDLFPVVVSIEERGQPSKWITLRALIALKRWYQMSASSKVKNA